MQASAAANSGGGGVGTLRKSVEIGRMNTMAAPRCIEPMVNPSITASCRGRDCVLNGVSGLTR